MRLISATVRNYRIHQELAVEFDPHVTVLGGPNEVGKSTLVEAIHRVLFLPHRTTGALRDAMRSHGIGIPEVELEFAIGNDRYRVRKRFNGQSGSADLEGPNGQRWRGDGAEEKLADLLGESGAATGRGANRVEGRWEHVWVFQGQATHDPVTRTANQHEALIQRLQELGGGALVQSARDAAVAKRVDQAYSKVWTERGSPRQNADVAQARERLQAATRDRDDALRRIDQLDDAVRRLDAATARLAERPSEGLKGQLTQQQQLARQLESLEQQLAAAKSTVTQAQQALDEFVRRCDMADEAEASLTMRESASAALAEQLAHATEDAQAAQQRVESSESELRGVQDSARDARRRRSLLQKQSDLLRETQGLADAQERLREAQRLRADRAAAMERLAELPQVTAGDRDHVAQLELAAAKANAALEAMAARIELLASDRPVSVDGMELPVGASRVLTEAAELTIGNGTTLRLSPGGGGTVRDAQRQAAAARQALAAALADVGVTSRGALEEVLRERERLEAVVAGADAALRRHVNIESIVAEFETRVLTLTAERDAARDAQQVLPEAADIDGALTAATEQEQQLDDKVAAMHAVLSTQQTEATQRRQATDTLREQMLSANMERARLQTQVSGFVSELGEAEARAERRRHLRGVVEEARGGMQRIERDAEDLRAADPAPAVERLLRALQRAEDQEREAELQRAVALEQLKSDGAADPSRRVADTEAEVSRAQRAVDTEQLRADAIKLLRDEFEAAQEDLAEQYAAPLRTKVQEYLRPVFGAGVGVRFEIEQDRFDALTLGRSGDEFRFDQLSGGTREQVSVAFRLAMVEILAAEFDDTLPIVLDDAFAYSDPDRLPRVHSMLDRAARNGVQVIVLSCTPRDYEALGGTLVPLSPPVGTRVTQRAASDDASDQEPEAAMTRPSMRPEAAQSQDPLVEAAVAALRERGGSMGNQALREYLELDAERYDELKSRLLDLELVRRGQGRGGTLVLVS